MNTETSFIDDLSDIPSLNDLSGKPKDRGLRVSGEDADGDYAEGQDDLGSRPQRERETYPCEHCRGTGRYQGVRRHQPAVECFACKGKGYFLKSYKDRMEARGKRAARKAKIADDAKALFENEHPGLVARVRQLAEWNDFAREMIAKFEQYHSWTPNQVAALERSIAKDDARQQAKVEAKQARIDNAPAVNVTPLHDAFAAAVKSELKVPMLRYEGFTVKLSKKDGVTLFVRSDNGDYYGKIVGGKYIATREAEAAGIVGKIVEAMNDPLAAAIAYGRKLGNCSCCGRRLVDPVSVANGIGPVCAARYGWDRIVPEEVAQERAARAEKKAAKEATRAQRAADRVATAEADAPAVSERRTKYEYTPGMTDADKRKLRAAARRAAKM